MSGSISTIRISTKFQKKLCHIMIAMAEGMMQQGITSNIDWLIDVRGVKLEDLF